MLVTRVRNRATLKLVEMQSCKPLSVKEWNYNVRGLEVSSSATDKGGLG
jgi:hypothetical protein